MFMRILTDVPVMGGEPVVPIHSFSARSEPPNGQASVVVAVSVFA